MHKHKTYYCGICKTSPDQVSHHKAHLETEKHNTKKALFKLQLEQMNNKMLQQEYNTIDHDVILAGIENIVSEFELENKKLTKKPLKEENNNTETNTNKKQHLEATSLATMAEIEEMHEQFTISNKDALRDKIHEIHNFLRNNGAGYGMNALKVFNILYGLKKFEICNDEFVKKHNIKPGEPDLYTKCKLSNDCKFSGLVKKTESNEALADDYLKNFIINNVLDGIHKSTLKPFLMYEIPRNILARVYKHIILEIDSITQIEQKSNVLLSGKIYEYFIGRDETAISELGAFFTDRHIVDYIYEKLKPKPDENGKIVEMIDMFGGSGGFTTGYIDYLNKNYSDKIKWETQIENIYHYDVNEDVIKTASLEMFCLTSHLPNPDKVCYKNSFNDEFLDKKFKLIVTNPPYGGDKTSETDTQMKQNKIKEYIKKLIPTIEDETTKAKLNIQLQEIEKEEKLYKLKLENAKVGLNINGQMQRTSKRTNKYANEHNLKANDKESVSLIMLMNMVDIDGTVCGVLKEGVFFNKAYKDIRKHLIETFNVREVISVPQDQFENTSTKTSILIFDNLSDTKTTTVKFSDMIVERYLEDKFIMKNGFVYLIENKGDISSVTDIEVSSATREEILANQNCSLNGKDYNKKTIEPGEGFKLIKLGDITKFLEKSKRKAGEGNDEGQYNFYTSSDKIMKCDIADYKEEALIIGDGGIANIKLDKMFSCSDHNFIITSKNLYYIFHFLKGNMNLLNSLFNGSVLKNLPKNKLINFNIPIPTTDQSIKQWVDKISKPFDEKNSKEQKLKTLELEIQNRIKEITENEDCEEVEVGSICTFKSGKFKTYEMDNNGKIPFYNASVNSIGFHSNYCFDDIKYLLLVKSGNIKANGLGSVVKIYGKCACVSDMIQIKFNNYIDYYYEIFKIIKDKIRKTANTSVGLAHIKLDDVKKIKISIPKDKSLITALEPKFQEVEKLQDEIKQADTLYKQYIDELSKAAIKQPIQPIQPLANTETSNETKQSKPKLVIKKKISPKAPPKITLNYALGNEDPE